MSEEPQLKHFVVWDYVVFALVLVVSAGIGIWYGCTGGKQKTTGEFLMANRQMPVLPVAMSLLASFMSAITLLGTPAEIYVYGSVYWWIWVAYLLLIPFSAHIFLPLFYRLNITSVYQYLEMRFKSKAVRMCAAIIFSIQMIMYMAIVLYAPSLALNQVTGLNVWISVCSVGIVCTFYTSIGGMKAVMWTDTFQIFMMFAGLIAVLVQGSIDAGGFGNIWAESQKGGRTNLNSFDPDPCVRHTFWTLSIGGFFTWLAVYGVNQAQVQRTLCVPNLRDGQLALWLNLPGLTALMTVCGLCGLVLYSTYKDCDPLRYPEGNPRVPETDQLLPFYVMENLSHAPGLPGLFTASLFAGCLSTISSGLNSLAAVFLEDIVKTTKWNDISDQSATRVTKIVAVVYGLICIGLTFVASLMGGVLQAALALFGVVGGPLLGVFMLAILCPFANWIGAIVGLFVSLGISFWVMIGNFITIPYLPKLSTSIEGCYVNGTSMISTTMSMMTASTTVAVRPPLTGLDHFYELSYLHYGTLATVTVVLIGSIVSLLTGCMKPGEVDPILLLTPWDVCCPYLPKSWRDTFRGHVPQYRHEEGKDEDFANSREFKDIDMSVDPPLYIDGYSNHSTLGLDGNTKAAPSAAYENHEIVGSENVTLRYYSKTQL